MGYRFSSNIVPADNHQTIVAVKLKIAFTKLWYNIGTAVVAFVVSPRRCTLFDTTATFPIC